MEPDRFEMAATNEIMFIRRRCWVGFYKAWEAALFSVPSFLLLFGQSLTHIHTLV
jgi:hypothetical protein